MIALEVSPVPHPSTVQFKYSDRCPSKSLRELFYSMLDVKGSPIEVAFAFRRGTFTKDRSRKSRTLSFDTFLSIEYGNYFGLYDANVLPVTNTTTLSLFMAGRWNLLCIYLFEYVSEVLV